MRYITLLSLLCLFTAKSYALDVGDISSFMYSDSSHISKEIKNPTDLGRLITVSVERMSSPLDSGKVIPMASKGEMLLSPASLILPANSSDVVRFYYKGPNDDKERYYRIVWFDQSLTDAGRNTSKRNAVATTSARIGTILVVSPRKDNFSYKLSGRVLKNTGNATFRTVAYGGCLDKKQTDDCKENYFVMPGMGVSFNKVDVSNQKGRIAIWHGEQFIPLK